MQLGLVHRMIEQFRHDPVGWCVTNSIYCRQRFNNFIVSKTAVLIDNLTNWKACFIIDDSLRWFQFWIVMPFFQYSLYSFSIRPLWHFELQTTLIFSDFHCARRSLLHKTNEKEKPKNLNNKLNLETCISKNSMKSFSQCSQVATQFEPNLKLL